MSKTFTQQKENDKCDFLFDLDFVFTTPHKEMATLEESLGRIRALTPQVLGEIPKSTAARLVGWSDDILQNLRNEISYGRAATFRANVPNILIRFYNFYLSGIIDEKDSLVAIVADACLLAQTGDNPIWNETDTTKRAIYSANTSAKPLIARTAVGEAPILVIPMTIEDPQAREEYRALSATYAAPDMDNFYEHIKQVIQAIVTTAAATRQETNLNKLTGFLALTLWRASTKNLAQMTNAFLKSQYRQNLIAFAEWPAESAFVPPCTSCLRSCTAGLQKGLTTTSDMFVVIAETYVKSRNPQSANAQISGYLSAAVLTHTARNGLGMIQLLEQACLITRREWFQLCELSYFDITQHSWKLILNFFQVYRTRDAPQYGFNWARIINDGYLRDYSPKEMIYLAGIFAGIISQVQGPGIWGAEWAKGQTAQLEHMKQIGIAIFHATQPDLREI